MAEDIKRITVNLRPSDVERIEQIAAETGLTANEIIRRALATESFVQKTRKNDEKILVEGKQGTRQVEFLY